VNYNCRIKFFAAFAAAAFCAMTLMPLPTNAGTLSTAVIGMFPKDMSEFAYADLKQARQLPWFADVQQQMLPANFRQFEDFLRSAGIDPVMQVDEMAWGAASATAKHPYEIAGIALGQFSPDSTEARFATQKIPMIEVRGFKLWAFGSGAGQNDIFFMFFDNNTAAFGQRDLLQRLIEVHFGAAESLTETFGYLASEAVWPTASAIRPSLGVLPPIPMWSAISCRRGKRSATLAICAFWPSVRNITGRSAFSASGQNQSAVPSVSHALAGPRNVSRTPSMPGCSRHFGSSAAAFGFFSGMRPMTAKRPG